MSKRNVQLGVWTHKVEAVMIVHYVGAFVLILKSNIVEGPWCHTILMGFGRRVASVKLAEAVVCCSFFKEILLVVNRLWLFTKYFVSQQQIMISRWNFNFWY